MRFLFRQRPVNSLQQALQLLHAAMAIAWAHRHNPGYRPTAEDLTTLHHMHLRLWRADREMAYITLCLQRRHKGEPEPQDENSLEREWLCPE